MGLETEDLAANPNSSMLLIASNWVTDYRRVQSLSCLSFLICKMGMILSSRGVVVRCREVDLVSFEATLVKKEM